MGPWGRGVEPLPAFQWRRRALRVLLGALLLGGEGQGLYDPVHKVASARLYGNIDVYAYYYVDLIVGTPPQRVSVILDTGSGVIGFPCASCGHCGHHIDPAFDYAKSSTAKWIGCGSGCRGSCNAGHCAYHQGYTEGSSISGFWFTDNVRLGDAIQRNPVVSSAHVGCHQNENKLFYTQKANGIMGVGPTSRNGKTLLQEMYADKEHISGDIFSICLAEWGGRLVVGGWNASYHTGALRWLPMTGVVGSYRVPLSSMRIVGGVEIKQRFGTAMIDSGTTYTYMGSGPYNALKGGIMEYCRRHSNCGATQRGNCWAASDLSGFPDVEVLFGDVVVNWVPKAYLYRKEKKNSWCWAFENDGSGANTVLGASFMIHQEVVFDMSTRKVGIAPAKCPEYRDRPSHDVRNLEVPTAPPLTAPPSPEEAFAAIAAARVEPVPVQQSSTSRGPTAAQLVTTSLLAASQQPATSTSGAQPRGPLQCWRVDVQSPGGALERFHLPGSKGDVFRVGPCLDDSLVVYNLGTASCQAHVGKPGRTIRNQRDGVVGWSGCCPERQRITHTEFGFFGQCSSMKGWQKRAGQSKTRPASRIVSTSWLKDKWKFIEDDPLRLAATMIGIVFVCGWCCILTCCCAYVLCLQGKGGNDHTRLKSVEEGVGVSPQVVGKPAKKSAGPETFVIGDEDDDGDLELDATGFEFEGVRPEDEDEAAPRGRQAKRQPSRSRGSDDAGARGRPQE